MRYSQLHKTIVITIFLLSFQTAQASPWISPGDIWLRSDIEYLSDKGIIKAPITTWPIMWSGIKKDFDRALKSENLSKLSQREQDALLRLKRAFRQATSKSSSVALKLASDTEVIRGFHDTPREESELELSRSDMGDNWAYQFNVSYVHDPYIAPNQKKDEVRIDGSYVATIYENFSIAYGYVDKWWGPGWDSSLILSNNARPSPGIMMQRNYSDPFESDWLSWIGPWTYNIFATVLDDERHITDAKLLGMSVSFKPFDSLEIGLRRTAQWGGEGRIQSFSSLVNMFLGKDNCGSGGIDACGSEGSNEPGNQLAAIDVRWRLPIEYPLAVYAQMMGEDEAGYMPSRSTYLVGGTSDFIIWNVPIKYYIEYSDTSTNFGQRYNYTYNHHIYQTGYRYQGRSIGSTYDNDSESFILGGILKINENKRFFLQLSAINLNEDNTGNHSINTKNIDLTIISMKYKQTLKYGKLEIRLNKYSKMVDENLMQKNDTQLGIVWNINLDF